MEFNETDYYYIFVLGYDLLQNYFKNQKENACDLIFEEACEIYKKFLNSEEIKNYSLSGYDALVKFLINNHYM